MRFESAGMLVCFAAFQYILARVFIDVYVILLIAPLLDWGSMAIGKRYFMIFNE